MNLSNFPAYVLQGYGFSTILFLIASLFSGPLRRRRKYYLPIANTIAAVAGILMACALGAYLTLDYFELRENEHTLFLYLKLPFLISIIFLFGISLLTLLSRKLRQYILFTLLLIFFLNTAPLTASIYTMITVYSSGEFIASSWAYYFDYRNLFIYNLPVSMLYFTIVYILAGKRQAQAAII